MEGFLAALIPAILIPLMMIAYQLGEIAAELRQHNNKRP